MNIDFIPGVYDCAKNFDKLEKFSQGEFDNIYFENDWEKNKYIQKLNVELFDNRCYITFESWAYQSENADMLWKQDWKSMSYLNQLIIGEVEPGTPDQKILVENFKQMRER